MMAQDADCSLYYPWPLHRDKGQAQDEVKDAFRKVRDEIKSKVERLPSEYCSEGKRTGPGGCCRTRLSMTTPKSTAYSARKLAGAFFYSVEHGNTQNRPYGAPNRKIVDSAK
jgi:hypothetical protein